MSLAQMFGYITIGLAVGIIGLAVGTFAYCTLRDKQRAREYARRKAQVTDELPQGAHGAYVESDIERHQRETYVKRHTASRRFVPLQSFTVGPDDDLNEAMKRLEEQCEADQRLSHEREEGELRESQWNDFKSERGQMGT